MRNPRFSVSLDPETYVRFRAFAKADYRSMGSLACSAIDEYINRKQGEQKRRETIRERRQDTRAAQEGGGALPVHASTAEGHLEHVRDSR